MKELNSSEEIDVLEACVEKLLIRRGFLWAVGVFISILPDQDCKLISRDAN